MLELKHWQSFRCCKVKVHRIYSAYRGIFLSPVLLKCEFECFFNRHTFSSLPQSPVLPSRILFWPSSWRHLCDLQCVQCSYFTSDEEILGEKLRRSDSQTIYLSLLFPLSKGNRCASMIFIQINLYLNE